MNTTEGLAPLCRFENFPMQGGELTVLYGKCKIVACDVFGALCRMRCVGVGLKMLSRVWSCLIAPAAEKPPPGR